MPEPSKADIDRLVYEKYPDLKYVEQTAAMATHLYRGRDNAPDFSEQLARLKAARAEFLALPAAELHALIAASKAREIQASRQLHAAHQAAEDAKRFFNKPAAMARFEVWCKASFWTVDEAAALLLGRDPHTVNPDSLARELSESTGLLGWGGRPQRTEFHRRFDDLRLMLGRAEGLPRPEMKPAEVIAWAEQTQAVAPPAALKALVPPAEAVAPAPAANEQLLKKAALIRQYEHIWPTIHSDFAHANQNGLAAVAKGSAHGMWRVEPALAWARQNGKTRDSAPQTAHPLPQWRGQRHTLEG